MIELLAALALQTASMPSCAELEYEGHHEDCRLEVEDERGLEVRFEFAPGDEFGEVANVHVVRGEETVTRFSVTEIESFFYPELMDVDQDGHADLLVPTITGNVNTMYMLHLGTEDGFADSGDVVSGHTIAPVEPGLFSVSARDSAVAHYVEYFAVEDGQLVTEALVRLEFQDEDTMTCALENGDAPRGEAFYCGHAAGE